MKQRKERAKKQETNKIGAFEDFQILAAYEASDEVTDDLQQLSGDNSSFRRIPNYNVNVNFRYNVFGKLSEWRCSESKHWKIYGREKWAWSVEVWAALDFKFRVSSWIITLDILAEVL